MPRPFPLPPDVPAGPSGNHTKSVFDDLHVNKTNQANPLIL